MRASESSEERAAGTQARPRHRRAHQHRRDAEADEQLHLSCVRRSAVLRASTRPTCARTTAPSIIVICSTAQNRATGSFIAPPKSARIDCHRRAHGEVQQRGRAASAISSTIIRMSPQRSAGRRGRRSRVAQRGDRRGDAGDERQPSQPRVQRSESSCTCEKRYHVHLSPWLYTLFV